ncbi:MAG: chemotaxis protein CheW, partial [Leptospira sp.]|nr:chemotaxis protein CheW [Leptospira sp.]
NLFSGASILGDGEIVLVLDVPGIARFANLQSNFSAETTAKVIENVSATKSGYLLIDVYGENFAVIAKDVMRIEKISRKQIEHTMDVQTIQFNGELIPVHELSEFFNLKSDTAIDDLFVVIFNINGSKKGLIATELLNVTENIPGIENNTIEGEFILGHAILSGKTTILIDTVAMLSRKISGTKQTLKGVSND